MLVWLVHITPHVSRALTTLQMQVARLSRDELAIRKAILAYGAALEMFIPGAALLMATAQTRMEARAGILPARAKLKCCALQMRLSQYHVTCSCALARLKTM